MRGINVGGKNIIRMAALVETFERMRFSSVKTFIASGNVIFVAPPQDLRQLEVQIEKELVSDFDYKAKVVVKSRREMEAIATGIAKTWPTPSADWRYDVMFLRHAIDDKKLVEQLEPRDGVETLTYIPGALLWATSTSALAKSTVARKMMAKAIYQELTVRNLNTTLKLAELLAAVTR